MDRFSGRPFWRTLFKGEAGLSERLDEMQRLELPIGRMMHEFLSGGVTYPWTLLMSAGIGAVLLATPLIVGTEPPQYFDRIGDRGEWIAKLVR